MAISGGIVSIGAGSAVQGYFGNKSSKRAARAAREAAERLRQAKIRAIGFHTPYETSGRAGLNVLTGLLTGQQSDQKGNLTTLGEQERADLFQKSPGYQFRLSEAQKALEGSQAARGNLFSGGAGRELSAYTQGIASNEYGSYINQLQNLAGVGQQAATSIGNIEIGAGSQIANYVQQEGNAIANRDAQLGNNIGGALSQIGGIALGRGLSGGSGGGSGQSGFSSTSGGGNYNNNVFSGYNAPNTTLNAGSF